MSYDNEQFIPSRHHAHAPTLSEFLLARIAEDERHVDFVRDFIPDEGNQGEYIDPVRVLAECETKRRIVEWAQLDLGEGHSTHLAQLLALPYADHPDYDESWRP